MRFIVFLVFLASSFCATGQEIIEYDKSFVSNHLGGVVEDPTGAGIQGAHVDLVSCASKGFNLKVLRSTVTDADGRFRFSRYSFRVSYCLRITKDGFNQVRLSMFLRRSQGEMHIKLPVSA